MLQQPRGITIPPPPTTETVTSSPSSTAHLSESEQGQLKQDIHLAKQHTKLDSNNSYVFDSSAARDIGMSQEFAKAYAAQLESAQSGQSDGYGTADHGKGVDCLVATFGWTIAFAALVAATAATGGAAALALMGYTSASIGWILSCYT